MTPHADFTLHDHGSIAVLVPLSEAGEDWCDDHIDPEALMWGGGIVIEPRYVASIIAGINDDGLVVTGS